MDEALDVLAELAEDDPSSGFVERGESATFEIEAEEGDVITAEFDIEEEGRSRWEATVRDPDGNELESERFSYSGFGRRQIEVTASQDGTYSAHVNPGRDRDARIRVNLWIA